MSESNKTISQKIEEYKQVLKKFIRQDGTVTGKGCTELKSLENNLELPPIGIALAYNSLGYEQLSCLNLDAANTLFQMAIKLDENIAAAHVGRGDILYRQGQKKEAITELERAKEIFNKQNMSQEAIQIDNYLKFINKHDNIWNKVLVAFGFRNLSKSQSFLNHKPNNYSNPE